MLGLMQDRPLALPHIFHRAEQLFGHKEIISITAVNGSAANVDADIAGAYGTLHVGSDGFYTYTANTAFDQLQAGDNPTEQFTITVADSLGQMQTTTLTFNFTGADDAPVIISADVLGSLTEDAGPTVAVNGGFVMH